MSNICMIPLMIGLRSIGMASDTVADKDEHNQPQNIPKRPRAHLLQLRIREMPRSINRDQRSPLSLILAPLSWIPPSVGRVLVFGLLSDCVSLTFVVAVCQRQKVHFDIENNSNFVNAELFPSLHFRFVFAVDSLPAVLQCFCCIGFTRCCVVFLLFVEGCQRDFVSAICSLICQKVPPSSLSRLFVYAFLIFFSISASSRRVSD